MAFSASDVEKLKDSIKRGVQRVEYQDKTVVYRSMDDMLKALRLMEEELGLKEKSSRVLAESSKGLC